MSGTRRVPRIYTIPPGQPFLRKLAQAVAQDGFPLSGGKPPDILELPKWTILLPTRRSAQELISEFSNIGDAVYRILPHIRAIGDVEEEQIFFETGIVGLPDTLLPPAISNMGICFLLARLLHDWAKEHQDAELARTIIGLPGQALALARSLGRLIESFDIEEVSLDKLELLATGDFAHHRQAMLEFLSIVRRRLPEEIARRGLMGAAARRSALLHQEAAKLEIEGARGPIIAAGSTGSIPATANLLRVIAKLEDGVVVLPGLDLGMDRDSWNAVATEPSHPQYGLHRLLAVLGATRESVELFPNCDKQDYLHHRRWLAAEIMRPTQTTDQWHTSLLSETHRIDNGMEGVELFCATDQREEARVIALIMRQVLETPEETANLVTPDRRLARRVKAELGRWQIDIDDTAGCPLLQTVQGGLIQLILDNCSPRTEPADLAALLKHPLVTFGLSQAEMQGLTAHLEIVLLRGLLRPTSISGLKSYFERQHMRAMSSSSDSASRNLHPAIGRMSEEDWRGLSKFIDQLSSALSPLVEIFHSKIPQPLTTLVRSHLAIADILAVDDTGGNRLWQGEAGEELSDLFTGLMEYAEESSALSLADYKMLINVELKERQVRPARSGHPRLRIMGLLEARLLKSGVTILGGLNQGIWPREPEIDPWLSRTMKSEMGLDVPERRIGLSAHDFVQCFTVGKPVLTFSRKIDGSPVSPCRWILRMQAVLGKERFWSLARSAAHWRDLAQALVTPTTSVRLPAPRPTPPVAARPVHFSVTRIAKLIANPYHIFAENILRLRPLDPLAAIPSAADRGNLIHEILNRFGMATSTVQSGSLEVLLRCGHEMFQPFLGDARIAGFWWKRFERIASWFIDEELKFQENTIERNHECEASSTLLVGGLEFAITARADRIDRLKDGSLRILDYKTGRLPSLIDVATGVNPQLPLEAWLAEQGKFCKLPGNPVSELLFMRLTGGIPAGEIRAAHDKLSPADLGKSSAEGLSRLLLDYSRLQTPYLALSAGGWADEVGDIGHLARTKEWLINVSESS